MGKCKECNCVNIEFRNSKVHGIGVFAIADIKVGQLLEECPVPAQFINYEWEHNIQTGNIEPKNNLVMNNYRFMGPKHPENGRQFWIIPGGLCMFYNSKPMEECNARVKLYFQERVMRVVAVRDIKKDEELFLNYTTPGMKDEGVIHNTKTNERKRNNKS